MEKLLILDAQPIVRAGVAHVVEQAGVGLAAVGAGSAPEALKLLRRGDHWACAVVDIVPEVGGISLLQRLDKVQPNLPSLVFTALPEPTYGARALRMGAAGFLRKDAAPQTLVQAVQRVRSGRRYVSTVLAEALAERFGNDLDAAPHERLTDREFEILRLLALGQRVAEVADSLHISPKTVHAHRANILRKTGLADNQALTAYTFEHGLIPERRSIDGSAGD